VGNYRNRETSSYWFSEAKKGANERQWNGDSKPETEQSQQRENWQRGTAAFQPVYQIQRQVNNEHNPTNNMIQQ